MLRQILTAASLALLLAGPATADTDPRRGKAVAEREPAQASRQRSTAHAVLAAHGEDRDGDRDRGRDRERGHDRGPDRGHDGDRNRDDYRGRGHGGDDGRGRDRDHDWRGHDGRDNDWRRDDDWRRGGWNHDGGRDDGWRYYRGSDSRHWRYVPPVRYSFDFGYRSGYELAWRDWLAYGRYDRYWRRTGYGFGAGYGYGPGYEAGWRDAAFYYGRGYRPDYWTYDPQGGWFFSFRIEG
jgi:hypothetical protein